MLLITSDTVKALGANPFYFHHRAAPRSFPSLSNLPKVGLPRPGHNPAARALLESYPFKWHHNPESLTQADGYNSTPICKHSPVPKVPSSWRSCPAVHQPHVTGAQAYIPEPACGHLPADSVCARDCLSVRLQQQCAHAYNTHTKPCTKQSICLREPAVRNESTISWNQVTAF